MSSFADLREQLWGKWHGRINTALRELSRTLAQTDKPGPSNDGPEQIFVNLSPGSPQDLDEITRGGHNVIFCTRQWSPAHMEVLQNRPSACCMSGPQLQGPLVGNELNSRIKGVSVILTQCVILDTFLDDVFRVLVPGGRFVLEWVSPCEPCDGTLDDPWSKCEKACLVFVESNIRFLYIPPGNTDILKEKIQKAGFKLNIASWDLREQSQFDLRDYYDHTEYYRMLRSKNTAEETKLILEDMERKLPNTNFRLQVSFLLKCKAAH
ncbi:hypothetical protein NQ176_g6776 [Zarea fungicola]|uniref:Uncharacterized protein n=1 Tax=Zarea fungicola TaxID=93591 RepID=A0ACC1N3S8_9HYPO|nr:hypothetical protein NQ176_g6776 [Lecanicillium fungicola]